MTNRLFIAIDGACRRNGKADCVASGGVYARHFCDDALAKSVTFGTSEKESTNQRGEMLALLYALQYIEQQGVESIVLTDSEYLFNAMTKEWYRGWIVNDWLTSIGTPVKNADLWKLIVGAYHKCNNKNIDIVFLHIKGHVIPFGEVTAERLICADPSGQTLHKEAADKFRTLRSQKSETIRKVEALSIKNNGYVPEGETLVDIIAANITVDAVATKLVNDFDKTS